MKSQFNPLVYVAMSGGVDSSVAAALLKKGGFNVVGVFMKPWQPEGIACLWQKDREDALRVATKLEIPLLTWDFSNEYKASVTDYMVREYKNGRTPNPDVMCNKEIKFGLFLKKALAEGADHIATGHYVRLLRKPFPKMLVAKDKNKDQSYFLWTLTQKELKYCLFPIGDYVKPEVRKLARKFGLPTADKKDSQGVCFVGPLDIKEFLKKYISPKNGKVINADGETVGDHEGVYYYTIGQRHGLDLGRRDKEQGTKPYYVTAKDLGSNTITVGDEKALYTKETKVSNINWVGENTALPSKVEVKIRYRTGSEKAILHKNGNLIFERSVRAITSGQSAVFYKNQEVLGGGVIV